jgi:hypothetical protein
MIMFSNGNSFSGSERRNTEPAYVRWLAAIHPGAVS